MNERIVPQIDEQYVFRDRYPVREKVYALFSSESEKARKSSNFVGGIRYGDDTRECFDIFLTNNRNSNLVVFFHGGYWQSLDRQNYSFIGQRLCGIGFDVALPSYPLCPGASLDELLSSAIKSITAIFSYLAMHGKRPACWLVSGHSAGGHIAAWIATNRWDRTPLGCLSISGIFNLMPIHFTRLDYNIGLTYDQIARLSPSRLSTQARAVYLAVGECETAAFLNQTKCYQKKLAVDYITNKVIILHGYNHYTVLTDLLRNDSLLCGAFCDLACAVLNRDDPI